MEIIRIVDLSRADLGPFSVRLADSVILTGEGKILMQQRPENPDYLYSGVLNLFGGHVESEETVMDGLIRELHEELGAVVDPDDVVFIGALTEDFTNHKELVHVHFWHDKHGTITGCYEAEAREFENTEQVLSHPKIMDYVIWALQECKDRELVK